MCLAIGVMVTLMSHAFLWLGEVVKPEKNLLQDIAHWFFFFRFVA